MSSANDQLIGTLSYILSEIHEFEEGLYELPQFLDPVITVLHGRIVELKLMAERLIAQAQMESNG